MKHFLLMIAVVALVGCGTTPDTSKRTDVVKIANPIIEEEIRRDLGKYRGELTKWHLEKVTRLNLVGKNLTDVKGLENLTQLEELHLKDNPDLTKAQIAELQNALLKCYIGSNPTK